jgi:hypothetical protein
LDFDGHSRRARPRCRNGPAVGSLRCTGWHLLLRFPASGASRNIVEGDSLLLSSRGTFHLSAALIAKCSESHPQISPRSVLAFLNPESLSLRSLRIASFLRHLIQVQHMMSYCQDNRRVFTCPWLPYLSFPRRCCERVLVIASRSSCSTMHHAPCITPYLDVWFTLSCPRDICGCHATLCSAHARARLHLANSSLHRCDLVPSSRCCIAFPSVGCHGYRCTARMRSNLCERRVKKPLVSHFPVTEDSVCMRVQLMLVLFEVYRWLGMSLPSTVRDLPLPSASVALTACPPLKLPTRGTFHTLLLARRSLLDCVLHHCLQCSAG